jgi:hypothetical protein
LKKRTIIQERSAPATIPYKGKRFDLLPIL